MSHVLDMPETTIHLTCSRTGTPLMLKLGLGGEVKATIVGAKGAAATESETAEE